MTKILVTGARGYIGRALTRRLVEDGCSLRLVSRSAVPGETDVAENVENVAADLKREDIWFDLLSDCHAVVHLSYHTDLHAAEADPVADSEMNLTPVKGLIRALSRKGGDAPIVLFASTVTIVGCPQEVRVDESVPDDPISVYDRHKLICEQLLANATERGLMRACSLRLSNVYGNGTASRNSNRGILNSMLLRAAVGQAITLFGDGHYIRDFIHLDDVISAFLHALADKEVANGSHYVIASGKGTALRDAFAMIAEETHALTGRAVEIRILPEPKQLHPIERRNFIGRSQLFQNLTGWSPRIELRAGIQRALSERVAEGNVI